MQTPARRITGMMIPINMKMMEIVESETKLTNCMYLSNKSKLKTEKLMFMKVLSPIY